MESLLDAGMDPNRTDTETGEPDVVCALYLMMTYPEYWTSY